MSLLDILELWQELHLRKRQQLSCYVCQCACTHPSVLSSSHLRCISAVWRTTVLPAPQTSLGVNQSSHLLGNVSCCSQIASTSAAACFPIVSASLAACCSPITSACDHAHAVQSTLSTKSPVTNLFPPPEHPTSTMHACMHTHN